MKRLLRLCGVKMDSNNYGDSKLTAASKKVANSEINRIMANSSGGSTYKLHPKDSSNKTALDDKVQDMDSLSRPELDAKLEAVEARMDARIVDLTGKIDGYMSRMDERDKRNDERFENITSSLVGMKSDIQATNSAIGSMKTTIITTGIASVIAIVFGVAAFNATVLSNMVASFESGKNTATAVSDSTKRLELLQDRIEAQQKQSVKPR